MKRARRVLAWIAVLALVAVACRAETSIRDRAADTPLDAQQPPPTAEQGSPADPPSSTVDAPAPASDAAAGEDPADEAPSAAGPFLGERPPGFDAPAGWSEPFALDAAVTSGTLPNGLRYLVRSNDRPGSQAQLRLVVRAGSLNEEPGTEGTAHFLEHMMFNGTERFPDNEIVRVLESFGSGFGPDVNAYTSFEETVYELQLPSRSSDTLQLGLDVLFQWATAATLEPEAIVAERGVVREEHRRATESLSGRIGRQARQVLFDGTDYLASEPIGSATVIESMTGAELGDFYEQWYRPELMTVVAVGDFDPAEMEERIAATFVQPMSDPPVEPPAIEVGPGTLLEPVFDVLVDTEIQNPEIEILWRRAAAPVLNRIALRDSFVSSITMAMVDDRLFERVQSAQGSLRTAGAGSSAYTPSLALASLRGQADADDVDTAVSELLIEIEQARQYGFDQSELDRQIAELRLGYEQLYNARDTRQDEALASELVDHALGRTVAAGAEDQYQIVNEVLDSITVADARAFLFDVLDSDPYVLVTAPAADEAAVGEPEALAAVYESIVGYEVEVAERNASAVTELMAAPAPVEVAAETALAPLDAQVVTFPNGVRMVYRQTQITDDVVFMQAVSPGGYFAVEGPEVPLLGRTPSLVAGSGFESLDAVALDRALSGSIASLSTTIGRAEESLRGESSTADLETLFQLIHLQMTEPTISDVRVRQFLDYWVPLAQNPESEPTIAADLELWDLRYGDSPWFRLIPTEADLADLDRDLLLEAYKDRFADAGDFTFAFVGDFDVDVLIDLGARYLGTLPDSGRREAPVDRDPGVPEDNLTATVAAGVGDQGQVRINWESPYPFTLEADVTAQALEIVVDARLRDLIREELGASYSPNASVGVLAEPKSWVDTIVEIQSDPDRVDEVSQVVRQELDRIRNAELAPVYLELAVDQLSERYRFFTNRQWLELLLFHTRYPDRAPNEFRSRADIAESLTVADLAAAAAVVFPEQRSVEVQLVPAEN